MTNNTQKTETNGKKPSHTLYVKSDVFSSPLNIKLAAMWEYSKGEGLNFGMEELILQIEKDKMGNPVPSLFVNTKIYGQPVKVKIGHFETGEDVEDNEFKMNLGDLVAFKNKPREEVAKAKPKAQPKP